MGYFSEIVTDARRDAADENHAQMSLAEAPTPTPPTDAASPVAATPAPASTKAPTDAASPVAHGQGRGAPAPAEAPTLDLTESEDQRRRAHDAAEAKRKAEWEAKQQEKRRAENEAIQRLASMSNEQVAADAAKRVAADTERLTRRNMKEAVAEHIQNLCASAPTFARLVMHPRKSMIRCFQYINRKAREYAEQEMKDNGIERTGVYGLDVPDGLCFQWATDYFNDAAAKEDSEGEEKFIPKPYVPKTGGVKPKPKKQAKAQPKKPEGGAQQLSLLEVN